METANGNPHADRHGRRRRAAGAIAEKQNAPVEIALRVDFDELRRGLQPDTERAGDTMIEHAGRTVLLPDDEISELFTGRTLDVEDDDLVPAPAQEDGSSTR